MRKATESWSWGCLFSSYAYPIGCGVGCWGVWRALATEMDLQAVINQLLGADMADLATYGKRRKSRAAHRVRPRVRSAVNDMICSPSHLYLSRVHVPRDIHIVCADLPCFFLCL